jgi:uncharacterized protein (TIGR03545 family)
MIKWIRWQGLVAFFAVVGVIMALWLLFVDGIVGSVIEKMGMSIVGAQVDVKADVKLFPLGITLTDLQVTNPDAPETNSFECRHIAFNVDSLNLLRRKVIINEMAVEGMRFDTKRKRAGKVSEKIREQQKKTVEERSSLFGLPVQAPDIKTILKNENLESIKLIESTEAEIEKKQADWQKRIDGMPNRATMEGYRARMDKIKQLPRGDVLGMAGSLADVRALRRDIEQDLDRVRGARTAFTTDISSARDILARAERAPFEDVKRLRDKYSISPEGLQNMTQLLFGDKIGSWTRSALLWYNRLQPIVERTKAQKRAAVAVVKPLRARGVDVRFKEYRPLPDFLIDRTAVSAETAAGILAGTVRNITPDQQILRQPLTFALTGEKMQAARSMAITGALNHILPERPRDTAQFAMRGFRLQNLVLSDNKNLPVALQDAFVDLDVNGLFTNALKGTFSANVNSANLKVGGEGGNLFAGAVRSALSRVTKFQLNGDISGSLQDYKLSISSDLDKVLKNAVGSVVKEQSAKLEQQLKTAIQERTGVQLKDLQASFGGFNQQGLKIDTIQNQLNGLLQETIKSAGGGRFKLP